MKRLIVLVAVLSLVSACGGKGKVDEDHEKKVRAVLAGIQTLQGLHTELGIAKAEATEEKNEGAEGTENEGASAVVTKPAKATKLKQKAIAEVLVKQKCELENDSVDSKEKDSKAAVGVLSIKGEDCPVNLTTSKNEQSPVLSMSLKVEIKEGAAGAEVLKHSDLRSADLEVVIDLGGLFVLEEKKKGEETIGKGSAKLISQSLGDIEIKREVKAKIDEKKKEVEVKNISEIKIGKELLKLEVKTTKKEDKEPSVKYKINGKTIEKTNYLKLLTGYEDIAPMIIPTELVETNHKK